MKNCFLILAFFVLLLKLQVFACVAEEKQTAEKWPLGIIVRIDSHGTGLTLENAEKMGVSTIQLATPFKNDRTKENAAVILESLKNHHIALTAVIAGFEGENYASIPVVKETVGLVPLETRKKRMEDFKEISDFAKLLKSPAIMFHLGFVPHDRASDSYREVVEMTKEICDYVANNGQNLHLETGQESAEALLDFIKDVDRPNLFINFDPANMILYGCGNPTDALRVLGKHVRGVHCKDALWSAKPGEEWGREVRFGTGDVHAKQFLDTLKHVGYEGPLTIEREIPESPDLQQSDVVKTIDYLNVLKQNIL